MRGGEALGLRNGFEHGSGFVDRFLEFGFRVGVVHPAAAGPRVSQCVLEQGGAEDVAAIQVEDTFRSARAPAFPTPNGYARSARRKRQFLGVKNRDAPWGIWGENLRENDGLFLILV